LLHIITQHTLLKIHPLPTDPSPSQVQFHSSINERITHDITFPQSHLVVAVAWVRRANIADEFLKMKGKNYSHKYLYIFLWRKCLHFIPTPPQSSKMEMNRNNQKWMRFSLVLLTYVLISKHVNIHSRFLS